MVDSERAVVADREPSGRASRIPNGMLYQPITFEDPAAAGRSRSIVGPEVTVPDQAPGQGRAARRVREGLHRVREHRGEPLAEVRDPFTNTPTTADE